MTNRRELIAKRGSAKLRRAFVEGHLTIFTAVKIIRAYPKKRDQDAELGDIAKSLTVMRNGGLTGAVEWYTPRLYLDAAIDVMGAIDLDPASSEAAQSRVGATRFYTVEDNGLVQPWGGRVFLNPPYAMPFIRQFSEKMVAEWRTKRMSQGIMLTNCAGDTQWFHLLFGACSAVCFTRGRIKFLKSRDGDAGVEQTTPTHGQCFFYFGQNAERFDEVFGAFGSVVRYPVVPASKPRLVSVAA